MKKRFLILLLLAIPAFGQTNIRWDWQANTVTGTGQMLPVLALPGAFVNFYTGCTVLPCLVPAVTYRSPTGSLTCPSNSQVVWQLVTGCHATADSEGNFGGWFQAGAYQYVITVSGHQTGPYNFNVGGGGGGGGINVFSAGNLPPLFTTAVTNPTTAPDLQFTLSNAAAHTILGNFTGSAAGPFYGIYSCTGLLTCTFDVPSNTLTLNVPTASSLTLTSTDPITLNGAHGPLSSGTVNVECATCGTAQFDMVVNPPIAGNYVIVYPGGGVITSDPPNLSNIFANGTSGAGGHFQWQCSGLLCSIAGNVQAHWTGFALPPGINPANVTAIYADAITTSGPVNPNWAFTDSFSGTNVTCNGQSLMVTDGAYPYNGTEVSGLTGLTGATFNSTAACSVQVGGSGPGSTGQAVDVAAIRFLVYSTDAPVPSDTRLHIQPPLGLNLATNTLYLDESDLPAGHGVIRLAAMMPPATLSNNRNGYWVYNGNGTSGGCTAGGGTSHDFCVSNGTSYDVWFSSGGTSGTYFTEVLTCTTTCTLAHTPAVFDNLSVNGLVMVNGTDFTRSTTTITLSTPAVGGDIYYAQYHY